jgi:hypothetical protein
VRSSTLMCAPSLSSRASMPPWPPMGDTPYVTHIPVMTGPVRRDDKSWDHGPDGGGTFRGIRSRGPAAVSAASMTFEVHAQRVRVSGERMDTRRASLDSPDVQTGCRQLALAPLKVAQLRRARPMPVAKPSSGADGSAACTGGIQASAWSEFAPLCPCFNVG